MADATCGAAVGAGGASASGADAAPAGPMQCCRRRSNEAEEVLAQQRYEDLLARGRAVDSKQRHWYDKLCWWSDVSTKTGARIFCVAPRGPKGQTEYPISMWELIAYCLTKLHDHVVTESRQFAIVWVQLNDHRLGLMDLRRLKASLHPRYLAMLEGLHIVHPSWLVRALRLLLWPIAEDELWDRWHAHERVEFLDSHVDMKKFRLPKDIYEYDKWLDKQAQEATEQANKRFGSGGASGGLGGFGGGAMEAEGNKAKEQMDQFKRLLEERGKAGKDAKGD